MYSAEFLALYERHIIQHEQTLWAEIVRRENSLLGRFKRWLGI